ncbi:hypothetical protein RvY_04226 [Ramazzottius varieornatus]|uniref:Copper type II ascorbate-dependent monooxygenase C-terminal domain-containing protein n=1 Tax=Ramazzottius varieornatus TaxID=947166 RepID=A0A1D1V0Y8_RAMVA|nr:hypothetical protein RvY_04226 [Ramazzottius varieornatus]
MDLNYDINYQGPKPVLPYWKFLPGGEGTMEGMCLVFLAYYPKVELSSCGSNFRIKDHMDFIGMTPQK